MLCNLPAFGRKIKRTCSSQKIKYTPHNLPILSLGHLLSILPCSLSVTSNYIVICRSHTADPSDMQNVEIFAQAKFFNAKIYLKVRKLHQTIVAT